MIVSGDATAVAILENTPLVIHARQSLFSMAKSVAGVVSNPKVDWRQPQVRRTSMPK